MYSFFHVALLLSATDSEAHTPEHSLQHTLETSTILHNGTYTSQPAGPQHTFERLLYTKEMSFVDQLVERLYTWGTC